MSGFWIEVLYHPDSEWYAAYWATTRREAERMQQELEYCRLFKPCRVVVEENR